MAEEGVLEGRGKGGVVGRGSPIEGAIVSVAVSPVLPGRLHRRHSVHHRPWRNAESTCKRWINKTAKKAGLRVNACSTIEAWPIIVSRPTNGDGARFISRWAKKGGWIEGGSRKTESERDRGRGRGRGAERERERYSRARLSSGVQ